MSLFHRFSMKFLSIFSQTIAPLILLKHLFHHFSCIKPSPFHSLSYLNTFIASPNIKSMQNLYTFPILPNQSSFSFPLCLSGLKSPLELKRGRKNKHLLAPNLYQSNTSSRPFRILKLSLDGSLQSGINQVRS